MLKKVLIALAATALVTLGATATAGAGGDIYAPKDCTKPKVEPKRITLACADDNILLKRLGWNEWNADKVKGQGRLLVNDCDPNCASGTFDKYAVKVTLLNIRTTPVAGRACRCTGAPTCASPTRHLHSRTSTAASSSSATAELSRAYGRSGRAAGARPLATAGRRR